MNRYRLNQILEILLFPVTDPNLGAKDPLLMHYRDYHEFHESNSSNSPGSAWKNQVRRKYCESQKQLIEYLAVRCHGRIKSEDDVLMLCNLYYPMDEIEDEMRAVKRKYSAEQFVSSDENICRYYLKKMSSLAASLITYRDGMAAIRYWNDSESGEQNDLFRSSSVYNKVEIWNLLCRITVPDLYITMAAVDNGMGMEALYEQRSYIVLADKLLDTVLQKGLAENHLHFNVGMDYEAVWLPYMDLGFLEEEDRRWDREKQRRLELALFRVMAACYLENGVYDGGFDVWIGQEYPGGVGELIYALVHGTETPEVSTGLIRFLVRMYQYLTSKEAVREGDYLLDKIFNQYLEYKVSSEFVLLYRCYNYIVHYETDHFFTKAFLQYIRYKNHYFRNRQESNVLQGLKYFKKRYDRMRSSAQTVMQKSAAMLEAFRCQARISSLKKLEIRVAPDVQEREVRGLTVKSTYKIMRMELYDQVYQILYAYRRYLLEELIGVRATWRLLKKEEDRKPIVQELNQILYENEKIQETSVPLLGIIFHFLKSEQLEEASDAYCWRDVRDGGREKLPTRMKRRQLATEIAIALEEIRSFVPRLDEYLVGIDAASEENMMEPWIFAQAYQVMRSNLYTKPVMREENGKERFHRIQNIGFTYHVGEEFRHIVSGFRHIDEVLEEFGYKAGDRLGHALALGIDVKQWVSANEVVPIPRLEHLENLLWMWGVNTCNGFALPIHLEVLEDKIMDIIQQIYPNPEMITIKMLYQAYKSKFLPDHAAIAMELMKSERSREAAGQMGTGCSDRYMGCMECRKKFQKEWNSEKLLMTNYCPEFIQKYENVELVSVTREEILVYEKLQEYLVHKVEKKGVYLEMNPTSNLAIGDFTQISQHPIFRLGNLLKDYENHVMVTVNSDDPAVFNTNVENELAYVYYAANELGYSKDVILEWIDHIRVQGMDASFIKQEKTTAQILIEIQEMLEYIKKLNQ